MNIVQDHIPLGRKNRPGRVNPMTYITVHNTGNASKGADAKNHAAYVKGDAAAAAPVSWHFSVDENGAVQHLPVNEDAYHAGDGAGDGNRKSIGIEICMNEDGNLLKATDNAAELVAVLCLEHNIPVENVKRHYDWTHKNCPQMLQSGKPYDWVTFIAKVRSIMIKNSDVPGVAAWAKDAWAWGVSSGFFDGTRPKDPITREEVITLFYRFLNIFAKS
jgi:N-acetylmuramoyl-L-alanine amidase